MVNNEDKIVEYLARMCAIIIFGLIIATILALCSCTRTIYVPQVRVERDSIYLHTHSRDSIWIHDSVTIKENGDTIRIEKWRTKYVEKLVTDTAYIERTDTIVQAYPVEKPLSRHSYQNSPVRNCYGRTSPLSAVGGYPGIAAF